MELKPAGALPLVSIACSRASSVRSSRIILAFGSCEVVSGHQTCCQRNLVDDGLAHDLLGAIGVAQSAERLLVVNVGRAAAGLGQQCASAAQT